LEVEFPDGSEVAFAADIDADEGFGWGFGFRVGDFEVGSFGLENEVHWDEGVGFIDEKAKVFLLPGEVVIEGSAEGFRVGWVAFGVENDEALGYGLVDVGKVAGEVAGVGPEVVEFRIATVGG